MLMLFLFNSVVPSQSIAVYW